jgi:type VI secretion system ImpM family protein
VIDAKLLAAGCFGKTPFAADFIAINAGAPQAVAFQKWLLEGAALAKTRLQGDWRARFDRAPRYRYVFWRGRPDTLLVGSIGSSRDQSGRRFPLTVFVVAQQCERKEFKNFPSYFSSFFGEAEKLIDQSVSEGRTDRIESVDELKRGVEGILSGLAPRERPDLREFKVSDLQASLSAPGDGDLLERAMGNMLELAYRTGRKPENRPGFGCRFPLPGAGPLYDPSVFFWLSLGQITVGGGETNPILFWTNPGQESSGHLDLYFRSPDPISFLFLVDPSFQAESIYPVHETAGSAESDKQGGRARVREKLREPALNLAELLRLAGDEAG